MQIIRWLEEGQETEDGPGLSDKTTEMSWTKKDWTEMGRWPISAESNLFSLHSLGSSLLRPTSIYQRWGQHPEDAGQRSCHPCPGGSDELLTFLSSIILEICFLHAQDQLSSGECLGSRTFAWWSPKPGSSVKKGCPSSCGLCASQFGHILSHWPSHSPSPFLCLHLQNWNNNSCLFLVLQMDVFRTNF